MHRYIIPSLLISSCIALHGASPARPEHSPRTEPLSIIDTRASDKEYVSEHNIGHDKGATDSDFNMLYYPEQNPFIVFAQKQASPKEPFKVYGFHNERVPSFADAIAIKTNLSAVHVGGALILLHSKSGNHKNLAFVQENFFKPFLIKDLLPSDFETILNDQLRNLSGQIKLYEEQAADRSTIEGRRAFEFAKTLRQKYDFVRCHMSCFALDRLGNAIELKEYTFGLPYLKGIDDRLSKFFALKKIKKSSLFKADIFTFGLTHNYKERMHSEEEQAIITRNVDRLGLLLAAHKYGHEIKNGIKPHAQISSFVMFDVKNTDLYNKAIEKRKELQEMHDRLRYNGGLLGCTEEEESRESSGTADIAVLKEFLGSSE